MQKHFLDQLMDEDVKVVDLASLLYYSSLALIDCPQTVVAI